MDADSNLRFCTRCGTEVSAYQGNAACDPLATASAAAIPAGGIALQHTTAGILTMERAGAWIGRYRLVEKLGEGGFGTVWRAEQRDPIHREVALKVIKPGVASAQIVARFAVERQALAMMDHPNIAAVLDAGETAAGRPFFVMELVKGRPITAYCDETRLTVRERLNLFIQVCLAIQHAHQKGILHRDLKPSNILVEEIDGGATPKIIDFGIAKALAAGIAPQFDASLARSLEGMVIGTPQYMSPEQAGSQPDVDTRSDTYSLGAVLYELLTGRPPLTRETLRGAGWEEILRRVRDEEIKRPSSCLIPFTEATDTLASRFRTTGKRLAHAVQGELDWIVLKALEKDRERRYGSANALAEDLARHQRNEPVQAGPPSRRYRLKKFLRRHKGPVAGTAAVVLALVCGVTMSLMQAARAGTAEKLAVGEKEKAQRSEGTAKRAQATAEGLINSIVHDLHAKLRPLGRLELLNDVSRQAEQYFEAHHSASATTPARLEMLAWMWDQRGEVLEAAGNLTAAGEAFEKSLESARQFALIEPENPAAKTRLAVSHERLSDIAKAKGDLKTSRDSCDRSLDLWRELMAHNPSSTEAAEGLSAGLGRRGEIAMGQGNVSDALRHFEEALELAGELVSKNPRSRSIQRRLAISLKNKGDAELAGGMVGTAQSTFEKSHEKFQQLADFDPSDANAQRDLSMSFEALAAASLQQRQMNSASDAAKKSSEINRRLAAVDPTNADLQAGVARTYANIGDMALAARDQKAAWEAFDKFREISQKLVDADPANSVSQRNLSVSFGRLGSIALDASDFKTSRAYYDKMLAIRQRLADKDTANAVARRDLSLCYEAFGDLAERSGELSEARTAYGRMREIQQHLAQADPADAGAQRDLAICLAKIARVEEAAGQLPAALEALRASHDIRARLAAADPHNFEFQDDWATSLHSLGELALDVRDTQGARSAFNKALEIHQGLAQVRPDDSEAKRSLSLSYERIGHLAKSGGDMIAASLAFNEMFAIQKSLAEASPDDTQAQRDLSISYRNQAVMARVRGNMKAAREASEESLKISRDLAAASPDDPSAQRDFAVALGDSANGFLDSGDTVGACRDYTRCNEIMERLAHADPDNASAQADFSQSLSTLGRGLMAAERHREARAALQKAANLSMLLATADPQNRHRERLIAVYGALAAASEADGDTDAAIAAYNRARSIGKEILAVQPDQTTTAHNMGAVSLEEAALLVRTKPKTSAADLRNVLEDGAAPLRGLSRSGGLSEDSRNVLAELERALANLKMQP